MILAQFSPSPHVPLHAFHPGLVDLQVGPCRSFCFPRPAPSLWSVIFFWTWSCNQLVMQPYAALEIDLMSWGSTFHSLVHLTFFITACCRGVQLFCYHIPTIQPTIITPLVSSSTQSRHGVVMSIPSLYFQNQECCQTSDSFWGYLGQDFVVTQARLHYAVSVPYGPDGSYMFPVVCSGPWSAPCPKEVYSLYNELQHL